MAISYGVTSTGFVSKPFQICRDEISQRHRDLRGNSIDVSDGTLDGNWIAILAERESALWDLGQAIYSAFDPDAATDDAQDAICALTGTEREQPSSSIVQETLTGTPATLVPAGAIIRTVSTSIDWITKADATIIAVAGWAASHAYVVGNRVTQASNVYQCITAGTSAGSGGPTTTAADITDGTVHWTFLGPGTGAIDVTTASKDTGPIVAVARDLTSRQTVVGGWQGAINLLDATLGTDRQDNESLRITRENEIADAGTGTTDAIAAALSKVSGLTSVTVLHNDTDAVDVNGQNPHTVQALISYGDGITVDPVIEAAVAFVLFKNVGSGLLTFGTTTVNVTDSQGTPQPYKFTRVTLVPIYFDVTLQYNPASASKGGYPSDGDAQVKAQLASFGASVQTGGKDVISNSARAAVFPVFVSNKLITGVQGVVDVTEFLQYTDVIGTPVAWAATTGYVATVGSRSVVTNGGRTYICITSGTSAGSGGPTGTGTDITDGTVHWRFLGATIPISIFQKAAIDTSRINVHSSAASLPL